MFSTLREDVPARRRRFDPAAVAFPCSPFGGFRVLSKLKKEGIIGTAAGRGEIIISNLEKLIDYDAF